MGNGPELNTPSFQATTPQSGQAPLQSSNPPINYTGSYGQPGNNFQGMGKSPQTGGGMPQAPGGMPQASNVPSNPMAQGSPQPMGQPMGQPMQQGNGSYGDWMLSPEHQRNQFMGQNQMGANIGQLSPEMQYRMWRGGR